MPFPSPDDRSKTSDIRKVARLYLEKLQDRQLADAREISEVLGVPYRSHQEGERAWARYCVALWEAVPGYLEKLLADPEPEPPRPRKTIWERLT